MFQFTKVALNPWRKGYLVEDLDGNEFSLTREEYLYLLDRVKGQIDSLAHLLLTTPIEQVKSHIIEMAREEAALHASLALDQYSLSPFEKTAPFLTRAKLWVKKKWRKLVCSFPRSGDAT